MLIRPSRLIERAKRRGVVVHAAQEDGLVANKQAMLVQATHRELRDSR